MGFENLAGEQAPIPDGLVEISDRQWPNPYAGNKEGREYRQLVLQQFLKREPEPRSYGNGQPVMSGDKARLWRAITDVADSTDTTESNVFQCATRMYDIGEDEKKIDRFLADLLEIEDEWTD